MTTLALQTTASVKQTFWRFALPSVAGMLVNGLYQIVDGLFVGHFVGSIGLAAINLTWPIIGLIIGFGILVGMGGGALISRYRGANDLQQAQSSLFASLVLMAVLAFVSCLYVALAGEAVLRLQGANQESLSLAISYASVFQWSALLTIAAVALPMLVRNDNRPYFATALLGLGALSNILLDYLLLGRLELGLRGAAIATVISQSLVVMIAIGYFFSSKANIKLSLQLPKPQQLTQVFKTGSSGLVMFLYYSLVVAVHNVLFMHYGSIDYVSAFATINYIALLYYLIAEGLANAVQPPVSYYFGAKQPQHINAMMSLVLKLVIGLGIATTVIANVFHEFLIGLFIHDNDLLLLMTSEGIRLHLFAMSLDGFLFVASVYFLSIGQTRSAMFVSLGNVFIQAPFLLILPKVFGITGIWIALPISNVVLSLAIAPLLIQSIRRNDEASIPLRAKQGLPFF